MRVTYSSIRQPLDLVPPRNDVHQRHARHLPDPPSEVAITRGDNVAL